MAGKSLIIPIPLGPDGMSGSLNQSIISPNELLDARNMTYFFGTQRKEGGTTKYNAVAIAGAPRVIGGWDWWPTPAVQRMVVMTSAGNLLRDTGGGTFATTLKGGMTAPTLIMPTFTECGNESIGNPRLLAAFTGSNQVQILSADGVTTSDISNPPSDWTAGSFPVCGCIAQGRLWAFKGSFAYYSNISNHQSFTASVNDTAGVLPIYPGEGEYIMAACSYNNYIIVWKFPLGVYYIDVSQPVPFTWQTFRLSNALGIDSPLAHDLTDSDVAFVWNGNPYLLSAVNQTANIKNADLGQPHWLKPWIVNNANVARFSRIQAVYYGDRREFQWAFSGAGNTINNLRLVADFNRPDTARFRYSDLVTCESIWLRKDSNFIQRPVAGDNAGFVRALDQEARSIDGVTGYMSRIQTPHDDFSRMQNAYLGTWGLPTRRKNGQWLEIIMEPKGNWSVSADIYWDGKFRHTVNYNMGISGATLGSFVLGTNALAGQSVASKRHRVVGSGRRFSVALYNSGAGQDFSLAAAYLGITLGDDRPGTSA